MQDRDALLGQLAELQVELTAWQSGQTPAAASPRAAGDAQRTAHELRAAEEECAAAEARLVGLQQGAQRAQRGAAAAAAAAEAAQEDGALASLAASACEAKVRGQ